MNTVQRIMSIVANWESTDRGAFIEDLLVLLPQDTVDNVLFCLEQHIPIQKD